MLKREGLGKPILVMLAVLCLLLAVASLWDEAISAFLYAGNGNRFGSLLAAFGELPAFTLMAAAGVVWIRRRGRSRRWKEMVSVFGGVTFVFLGVVLTCLEILEDLPQLSFVDGALITAVIFAVAVPAGLLLTRNASRLDCFRFLLSVLFVCGVSMIAANLLKYPWARPRPWYLLERDGAAFVPWWRPGGAVYPPDVPFEASRSFPSGHTATAACSVLWTLLAALHPSFEGRGRLCFFLGAFFTALVALSRLTMGAHFLSDVVITWMFVYVLFLLSQRLFYRDSILFRSLYRLLT